MNVLLHYWHRIVAWHPWDAEVTFGAILWRLIWSWFSGLILGAERRQRHPELDGLDLAMVSLVMTGLTLVSAYGFAGIPNVAVDPSRIVAQWGTALGAFAVALIIRSNEGFRGLTSAITLLLDAVIGIIAGTGSFGVLGAIEVIALVTLLTGRLRNRISRVRVVLVPGARRTLVTTALEEFGVGLGRVDHHSPTSGLTIGVRSLPKGIGPECLVELLEARPDVERAVIRGFRSPHRRRGVLAWTGRMQSLGAVARRRGRQRSSAPPPD